MPSVSIDAARSPPDLYTDKFWRWHLDNDPLAWMPSNSILEPPTSRNGS